MTGAASAMDDGLRTARRRVEQIRFSKDIPSSGENIGLLETVLDFHLANALNISQTVTPSLHGSLEVALENLSVPSHTVEAFVYASPEIQAGCHVGKNGCVLRFSSALVDILDENEFKFVAGHELGHFLFGHDPRESRDTPSSFIQQHAREVSSDRAGLIACDGSLNAAVNAMMKTASGLTGKHLRFNVSSFLSQLRKSSGCTPPGSSTHPPILVRCRALHWFSLSGYFDGDTKDFSREQSRELDERVRKDLSRYANGHAEEQIAEAKENIKMWTSVRDIVQDGKFDKEEQQQFTENFGQEKLEKLKNFLENMPLDEIKNAVAQKLKEAQERLKGWEQ